MNRPSTIYKIDDKAMLDPTSAPVSMEDLELSAERDSAGYVHRERVRQGVRKVSFTYEALTQAEYSAMAALLTPVFFSLTYLDPVDGVKTIEAYSSKKDGDLLSATLYNGLWRNVKFNCIER